MEKLVGVKEVAARFGVSVRGVWRLTADGTLPQPVRLTEKSAKWCESELDAVFEKLKRQRGPMAVN